MIIQKFKYDFNRKIQPNVEFVVDGSCCGKRDVNVAIFCEHRQSFYYWSKWGKGSSILTIDLHEDLSDPNSEDKIELDNVDFSNDYEVFQYTMFRISFNNDTQIMSAIWGNKINNVYALLKDEPREFKNIVKDKFKNEHKIYRSVSKQSLLKAMIENNETSIHLDIDLDYFTILNPYNLNGDKFTYMSKR